MSGKTSFLTGTAARRLVAVTAAVFAWGFIAAPAGIAEESAPAPALAPDANRILELARNSYALQSYDLEGSLRKRKEWRETNFDLSMREGMIWFKFSEPDQVIHLEFKDDGYLLHEAVSGGASLVAPSRYGEAVRETDLSYEDLSMRFLYWPGAKLLGMEKFSVYHCWKVAVSNPDSFGPYHSVVLWVDEKSGSLMQMLGLDRDGKTVRRFLVTKVQQIRGAWMLEEMRVERYDIASGKVAGMTYLTIKDPDKKTKIPGKKG